MNLLDQLERDEGFRAKPYLDTTGHWTVGFGWNMEAVPLDKDIARLILEREVEKCTATLRRDFSWFDGLSECRQGVLINMAYNLGLEGLKKFQRMLTAVAGGYYKEAAKEMMDSKWARQVGQRAVRLATQMETDSWQ